MSDLPGRPRPPPRAANKDHRGGGGASMTDEYDNDDDNDTVEYDASSLTTLKATGTSGAPAALPCRKLSSEGLEVAPSTFDTAPQAVDGDAAPELLMDRKADNAPEVVLTMHSSSPCSSSSLDAQTGHERLGAEEDDDDAQRAQRRRHYRVLVGACVSLGALMVVAAVLGSVLGTQLNQNQTQAATMTTSGTTTATTQTAVSSMPVQTPRATDLAVGTIYPSTFTYYGSGDYVGSPNCSTAVVPCGFFTSPGFSAAVSQNLFGPLSSAGLACGTCWSLVPETDATSGSPLGGNASAVVVMVNNACPAAGNPLCGQRNLTGAATNQYGGVVDFNLCVDSGAAAALFGESGVGLARGTATRVDCAQWSGGVVY